MSQIRHQLIPAKTVITLFARLEFVDSRNVSAISSGSSSLVP